MSIKKKKTFVGLVALCLMLRYCGVGHSVRKLMVSRRCVLLGFATLTKLLLKQWLCSYVKRVNIIVASGSSLCCLIGVSVNMPSFSVADEFCNVRQ